MIIRKILRNLFKPTFFNGKDVVFFCFVFYFFSKMLQIAKSKSQSSVIWYFGKLSAKQFATPTHHPHKKLCIFIFISTIQLSKSIIIPNFLLSTIYGDFLFAICNLQFAICKMMWQSAICNYTGQLCPTIPLKMYII